MRGTDMLLAEGMNLKVLLFPDNDDPDSFARKHTAAEFRDYIAAHQTDFIEFKTRLLLDGEADPQKRAEGIGSIVSSISVIPNQILRDTYLKECSQRLGINETTLINQMNRLIRDRQEQRPAPQTQQPPVARENTIVTKPSMQASGKVEWMLAQMLVRHGEHVVLRGVEADDGQLVDVNIAQYIYYNLGADGLQLSNALFNRMLDEAVSHSADPQFNAMHYFLHHQDIEVARVAAEMSEDRYHLTEQSQPAMQDITPEEVKRKEESRTEALLQQTTHLLLDFRMDYVEQRLRDLKQQIAAAAADRQRMMELMQEFKQMQEIRNSLAKQLGSNIII